MRRAFVVPAVPLMLLAGCGAPTPAGSLSERSSAIIGGVNDPGDPAVVLLIASTNQGQSLCTAEVVSPHVLLTAAHCVDPVTVGQGAQFQVFLGTDLNNPAQANNASLFVDIGETHYDQKFNINNLNGGHDVAVAIAQTALKPQPITMNRAGLDNNDIGATVRLIGYGITSGADRNGTTAGTKRQTSTTIGNFDNLLIEFDDPSHLTCEGDSGGPALLMKNGQEVIAGITSFGDQGCRVNGFDTRVDDYLPFVDGYIQLNDPGQMMNPSPDMAGTQSPPDLAMSHGGGPHGGPDMALGSHGGGLDGGVPPGKGLLEAGGSCTANADCHSGACALVGASGYCTQPCTAGGNDCPAGLVCGQIDGQAYCVQPVLGHAGGGCSVGGGDAPPAFAWALLLPLFVLVARHRRAAFPAARR